MKQAICLRDQPPVSHRVTKLIRTFLLYPLAGAPLFRAAAASGPAVKGNEAPSVTDLAAPPLTYLESARHRLCVLVQKVHLLAADTTLLELCLGGGIGQV